LVLSEATCIFVRTIKKVTAMDEKERRASQIRLNSLFQQLHFTVIYETEIVGHKGLTALLVLRDAILDEIILLQRKLGLRI
jgi:hypothetical protein